MALSFSCPSCRAELQLPDEAAGQSGQCPRCQAVLRMPSSTQPRAVVLDPDTGAPVQTPAAPPPKPAPPLDRAQPSRRQPRSVPPKTPAGPIWPNAVGIVGGLLCVGLLFASVVTLFSVRATESAPSKKAPPIEDVRHGWLERGRAGMPNGLFEVHTRLSASDGFDPDQIDCRCKRYEITLAAKQPYVITQDSPTFDCVLRIEGPNNQVLNRDGGPGRRNARLEYTPQHTELFVIYATSDQPAFGPMTLTIRELRPR